MLSAGGKALPVQLWPGCQWLVVAYDYRSLEVVPWDDVLEVALVVLSPSEVSRFVGRRPEVCTWPPPPLTDEQKAVKGELEGFGFGQ